MIRIALLAALLLVIGGQLYAHYHHQQHYHYQNEETVKSDMVGILLSSSKTTSSAAAPAAAIRGVDEKSATSYNNKNNMHHASASASLFGACLMFKDDMDLLPEWIAYHYTILPLRYLILGVDVGNQQDPRPYLQQWNALGLQYKVVSLGADDSGGNGNIKMTSRTTTNTTLNVQQCAGSNLHGNHSETTALEAHHAFVDRQKVFVQQCTMQMQAWNVHWTTFIDSDEFITYNNNNNGNGGATPTIEHPLSFETVASSLQRWQDQGKVKSPCYTLPRLRYGALENATCTTATPFILPGESSLTTRRFVQHARPGDFASNKFGKVILNVSAIPPQLVQSQLPRNIHRPYRPYCGPAAAAADDSVLLRANHYVGALERFTARAQDARRTQAEWHRYAWHNYNASCDDVTIQSWVARFVTQLQESQGSTSSRATLLAQKLLSWGK